MGFHVELVWSNGLKERIVKDVPEQLNEAIDFAKDEYNYCLNIDKENKILSASVINEQTDLVVWSTDDAPELKKYEEYTHDEWHTILHGHHPKCYNPSVYFDIDGTLGYWYPDGRGYTLDQIFDPTTHYFRDIEPHPLMIDLAKMLYNRGLDVCIISAASKDTIRDKWEWIDKYLPFIPKGNICFSPLGADKNNYVKGNAEYSILIDDYWVNLDNWKGISIKAINTVNSHQNKYPEIDFTKLEAVLNEEASYYNINPFNVKRSMMAIYEVSKAADRIEKIINELSHKHKFYVMEAADNGKWKISEASHPALKGWRWIDFWDGSGHLEDASGREICCYDMTTKEVMSFMYNGKWDFASESRDEIELSDIKRIIEKKFADMQLNKRKSDIEHE